MSFIISPFIYTFPSSGTYTICAESYNPVTGEVCDLECMEICVSNSGYRPALTPDKGQKPNTGLSGTLGAANGQKRSVGELFPNPTSSLLNIPISGYAGDIAIEISSAEGKKMLTQHYTIRSGESSLAIRIKDLPAGTYFIQIGLGADMIQRKFTKQ